MNRWSHYNENTKYNPPRELYSEAVELVSTDSPLALDIAAGALNETKDMLNKGFRVTATDSNSGITDLGNLINDNNLSTVVVNMEGFDYGIEKFDFIIAMFALPFMKPKLFARTFNKIIPSLKKEGIFAFHLFGKNDDWSGKSEMTFHDQNSAKRLIEGLKIVKFKEIEIDGKIANGDNKHWHVFQIIVIKGSK